MQSIFKICCNYFEHKEKDEWYVNLNCMVSNHFPPPLVASEMPSPYWLDFSAMDSGLAAAVISEFCSSIFSLSFESLGCTPELRLGMISSKSSTIFLEAFLTVSSASSSLSFLSFIFGLVCSFPFHFESSLFNRAFV